MLREAGPGDVRAMRAFLERHIETSMFLLGNLESHGTGNTAHPHGTRFLLHEDGAGLSGVFGVTNGGFAMCQAPGLTAAEARAFVAALRGVTLCGMTGEAAQVAAVLDALPVAETAWRLNRVEPLFRRDLEGLDGVAPLRAVAAGDVPMLAEWFAQYMQETETQPPGDLQEAGQARAQAAVGAAHIRLMEDSGGPVAMAAVNARAGLAVQVGGVFVPAALRGVGRAGRVVSALLAECAAQGARTAILFAASAGAARAYTRIGFAPIGGYRVALLHQPVALGEGL